MARGTTRRLFARETLEDGPTIRTIRKLLEVIADERLLASLTKGRGRGRNDVRVQVAWRLGPDACTMVYAQAAIRVAARCRGVPGRAGRP